jgi:hypothetical protein
MTKATPDQLAKLERFVADQPASWEVLERAGHHFANLTAKVTDEYVWWLQLDPQTPEDSPYAVNGGHPTWQARCQKGTDGDEMHPMSGSLADCVTWLEHRTTEWKRERQVAAELEEFAAGRPKWNFYDQPQGRHYAGRRFDYGPAGERFLLSALPHNPSRRRDRFRAQINMAFAAGPEHTQIADTIDQIAEWVTTWEKILEVPLKLAECDRGSDAWEIVEKMRGRDLANLAYLLDIDGNYDKIRRRLLEKYAPSLLNGRGKR